jgi:methyl-accepting chemotaxis protein
MKKIAAGEVSMEIMPKDAQDEISPAMLQLIVTLRGMSLEVATLTEAGVEGELSVRGKAEAFTGEYRNILQGVNDTLDAVIKPVQEAAAVLEQMALGNLGVKISGEYRGDHALIKEALNGTLVVLNDITSEAKSLSKCAVEGKLSARSRAENFKGEYRNILQGVNDTLDSVIMPIQDAARVLHQMNQGDLSVEVTGEYHGDHALIKDALNGTLVALNDILGQISLAVNQVTSGARQVSDSAQSLSQGATEQASNLEEITSSMTEIASQTTANAQNASRANQMAISARTAAEAGDTQMRQLLFAMTEINESSGQISKIIKVIDDIAFQTNLLALNAAVEAARAGVHGKGFAVVAEEVRNLAQRSAKAAKETTELIEGSVKKVEHGTAVAQQTANALDEIVGGITQVTDLVSDIASASNEQALGIKQTNEALDQIDQVTQSNTANAEESAAAAEQLSSQAKQLKQMLSRFRLCENHRDPCNSTAVPEQIDQMVRELQRNQSQKANITNSHSTRLADIIALDDAEFGEF